MTNTVFNDLLTEIMKVDYDDLTKKKAVEYSYDDNRFFNFISMKNLRNATKEGHSEQGQLWNLMIKQFICVQSWIDSGYIPTNAEAFEKIGDIRKYLYILELIFMEKSQNNLK